VKIDCQVIDWLIGWLAGWLSCQSFTLTVGLNVFFFKSKLRDRKREQNV